MALIKCPDCGKKVSDRAVQCIHCGCPLDDITNNEENSEMVKVFVERKNKFVGCAITSILYIDGEEIISLNNGESCELSLNPGIHQFSVRKGDKNTILNSVADATFRYDVKSGKELYIKFEPKMKLINFYFDMCFYESE